MHLSFSHFGVFGSFLACFIQRRRITNVVTQSISGFFPPPSLPFSTDVLSVTGASFFPAAWGLMVGLPGFPSYGSGLHLGAGCQYWKLLGITGTQPPLSNAVVNGHYLSGSYTMAAKPIKTLGLHYTMFTFLIK